MKLFLTSAGLPPETTQDFLDFLNEDPKKMKICFITTASHPEKNKWYIKKDAKRLSELGFQIEEFDLRNNNEDSLRKRLKTFDIIFVEGGNTFYLLKYVKESGFDHIIHEFLTRGGVYVGVSAGTIITGLNIETSNWNYGEPDKNIVNLEDLEGLNLIPFVFCVHMDKKDTNIIKKYATETNYPTVGLTDTQALLIDDKIKKIVGTGEKFLFNIHNCF